MHFEHCVACPSPGACSETVAPDGFTAPISCNGPDKPGMCWNAYMNVLRYDAQRVAAAGQPAPAPAPAAQASPSKAPSSPSKAPASAPGTGTVTERIFAACDAALARMWPDGSAGQPAAVLKLRLDTARKHVIPLLEAAGINPNSARKGSSMWVAARQ